MDITVPTPSHLVFGGFLVDFYYLEKTPNTYVFQHVEWEQALGLPDSKAMEMEQDKMSNKTSEYCCEE